MSRKTTSIVSLDLETTMRCERKGFSSAFPHDPSNFILAMGAAVETDGHSQIGIYSTHIDHYISRSLNEHIPYFWATVVNDITPIIVGHNIKFDLSYLAHACGWKWLSDNILCHPIWDTSIAEYMLSGQLHHYPSLADSLIANDIEEKKLGTLEDIISKGGTTEDVLTQELEDYMIQDCRATLALAKKQMEKARETGMMKAIYTQCAAMKALMQMEYHGIKLDLRAIVAVSGVFGKELDQLVRDLDAVVMNSISSYTTESVEDIDPLTYVGSNQFWSSYLFGGDYSFKWKTPNGTWKSGERKGTVKYKTHTLDIKFKPIVKGKPEVFGASRQKTGNWTVDSSVLTAIYSNKTEPHFVADIANNLLRYRELNKLITTYVDALPTKVFGKNDIIHPNINQTSTFTGRLSQTNPNLQNQASDGRIKRFFVPSSPVYGFIEADYKQLEVIAFAFVYRDPQLIKDLRDGIDIHDAICMKLYDGKYTKEQRRVVKGVNFGTIYGGGAQTIARQSGIDQAIVWEIQREFFHRYSTVKNLRKHFMTEVAKHTSKIDGKRYGQFKSITGRVYNIPVETHLIETGSVDEPHFTKVCNYPIQGLATGDIVPMMLAYVEKYVRDHNLDIVMVNTVHDSILFQAPVDSIKNSAALVKSLLEEAPTVFERVFKYPFDLPLKVEVSYTDPRCPHPSWNGPWLSVEE